MGANKEENTYDKEEISRALEALLFVAPKAVSFSKAMESIGLENEGIVLEAAHLLKERLEKSKSALELIINEESKTMLLKPKAKYAKYAKEFFVSEGFSKAVKKTLALIAYLQPVKQSIVVKYRGNRAYEHIKWLSEKGLIKKEKTKEGTVLRTTKRFLEFFEVLKTKKEDVEK